MSKPDEAVATAGQSFTPHPADQVILRCVDCINLGEKVEQYQGKGEKRLTAKVALVFLSPLQRDDGENYQLSREFTLSVGEKANLRKFLTAWRGKSFTDDEAKSFAVHGVVGVCALATIEHVTRGDRTYANISSITRVPASMPLPPIGEYTRSEYWEKKRATYKAEADAFRVDASRFAPADKGEQRLDDFPPPLDSGDDELPF